MARLHRYVKRRVGDGPASEDIVHDILVRLHENQAGLANAHNPGGWLYRIASNAVVDHYRKRARHKELVASLRQQVSEHESEDAPVSDPSLTQCLEPLVQRLPEPYRNTLLLTDLGELSQADAAREIGISISGMKSRVQRGRQKLREALLKCCAVEMDRRGRIIDFHRRPTETKRCDC